MLVGHMRSGFQVMLDDLYLTWHFAMCLWWFECAKIYYTVFKPVKLALLVQRLTVETGLPNDNYKIRGF